MKCTIIKKYAIQLLEYPIPRPLHMHITKIAHGGVSHQCRSFCIDCTCAVSESGIMIHRSASVKTTGKILKRKKITDKTLKNNFKNKFKGRAAT